MEILTKCFLVFGKNIFLINKFSDGHGLNGHEVSGFLKDSLPDFLDKQIQIYSDDCIESIIEEAFLEMNFYLHTSETIDTLYSGSTCVSLVYTPEKLICANVGDSRAVLGKFRNGSKIFD